MLPVKKLQHQHELLLYCKLYEKSSGLKLEIDYLNTSMVYGLFVEQKLVGGYVLHSTSTSSRTLNCFVSPSNIGHITNQISLDKTTEICCFWISRKMKKFKFHSSYLWIDIAMRTFFSYKNYYFYGTNNRGLAALYSMPRVTKLMHIDHINGRPTWTFYTKKSQMLRCIWSIIGPRINPFHKLKINTIWSTKFYLPQVSS